MGFFKRLWNALWGGNREELETLSKEAAAKAADVMDDVKETAAEVADKVDDVVDDLKEKAADATKDFNEK